MRVFVHCLLRANFSDVKWRGQEIKRGQFVTSLESLSSELSLTISQIRTALKKLESTGDIASLSQARSRVITVVKYDQHQSDRKLAAGSSQADDKLIAADNNEKNKKNENKNPLTVKKFTDDDLEMVNVIYSDLLVLNPEHKKPNLEKWADVIRLMREQDNRAISHIHKVWKWANKHHFWSTNIESPASLRQKFDKLVLQANRENQNAANKPSGSVSSYHEKREDTFDSITDYTRATSF